MKRLPKALVIGGAEDDGGTGVMARERKATKSRLAHAGVRTLAKDGMAATLCSDSDW
jgi:hypothetical protein